MTNPSSEHTPDPLPTGTQPPPSVGSTPTSCWPTARSTGVAPFHRPEDFPTTAGNDGRIAWALGLLGFLSVPGLAALVTGIVLVVVGLLQRRKNPVAARTGRGAAILGATLIASVVIFFSTMAIGISLEQQRGGPTDGFDPLFLIIVPVGIWMLAAGPLVAIIMGFVALARPVSRDKAARILGRP